MIPWFEWPYIYDVRARPNVIQSTSGSRDLQMVKTAPSSMTLLIDASTGSRAAVWILSCVSALQSCLCSPANEDQRPCRCR